MFEFDAERSACWPVKPGMDFVVPKAELESNRKAGKQVVNTSDGNSSTPPRRWTGDMIAVVGTNRKILIFPLEGPARDVARQGQQAAILSGQATDSPT